MRLAFQSVPLFPVRGKPSLLPVFFRISPSPFPFLPARRHALPFVFVVCSSFSHRPGHSTRLYLPSSFSCSGGWISPLLIHCAVIRAGHVSLFSLRSLLCSPFSIYFSLASLRCLAPRGLTSIVCRSPLFLLFHCSLSFLPCLAYMALAISPIICTTCPNFFFFLPWWWLALVRPGSFDSLARVALLPHCLSFAWPIHTILFLLFLWFPRRLVFVFLSFCLLLPASPLHFRAMCEYSHAPSHLLCPSFPLSCWFAHLTLCSTGSFALGLLLLCRAS